MPAVVVQPLDSEVTILRLNRHNLDSHSMGAAIALENRKQDLANKASEVRQYMSNYAQQIRKD